MTKVMLVEDDNSLREIYSIRLTAEGYTIVSAGDGEEALATAVRERPNLIISDVMMPKISGFDMLDILRSTPETKDIKVIMMTALSSEDQRSRGENLGADRYLVKSQVGIEDVVNTVHDVLGDRNADGTINPNAVSSDAGNTGTAAGAAPVMGATEGELPVMSAASGEAPVMSAESSELPVMGAAEGNIPAANAAPMQEEKIEQIGVPPVIASEAPAEMNGATAGTDGAPVETSGTPAAPGVVDNPADLGIVGNNGAAQ